MERGGEAEHDAGVTWGGVPRSGEMLAQNQTGADKP
jgi:hypothetical protein